MKRDWEWCPFCRGSLDTGWECNDCGADLMPYAYPKAQPAPVPPRSRFNRLVDWLLKLIGK